MCLAVLWRYHLNHRKTSPHTVWPQYFREVWPNFFAGEDKHWPLFETIDFSHEPYNAAFVRELPAYDLRDRIGELNVPMLLIVGSHDAYRPHMEWLAEHAPTPTLCVLEGVGHVPFVEAPDEFVKTVVSFLTSAQSAEENPSDQRRRVGGPRPSAR